MAYPGPVIHRAHESHSQGVEMPLSSEPPTAPSMEQFKAPPGYEAASFSPTLFQPPPPSYEASQIPPATRQVPTVSQITEEEVRSALHDYTTENCCFSGGAVNQIKIKDIVMKSAFHYNLETFSERRETKWAFEPFTGQPIDGAQNGSPPPPWSVFAKPDVVYKNTKKVYEVPHTANVRICHKCTGIGRSRCRTCAGMGGSNCERCTGTGRVLPSDGEERRVSYEACRHCRGTGRKRCSGCHGHGQTKCSTCKGFGQLKFFLQLIINWINHRDNHVSESTGCSLSEDLLKQVSGNTEFQERGDQVFALTNFPDTRIVRISKEFIHKHKHDYPSERVLDQRHNVKLIPIGMVFYEYENKSGQFYVYGLEHKVYFPDYPSKWGCSIM